jgi:hypothetical protein
MARTLFIGGSLVLAFALTAEIARAQQIEIHPYAGAFFPGSNIKDEGIYGVRGGVYLIDFIQLDANYGYINHFTVKDAPDTVIGRIFGSHGSFSLRI